METQQIRPILEQQITDVERSYAAQTGGVAMCQLQKDGRITGGVKYDEGRLIALHTARRLLPPNNDDQALTNYRAAIESELATWHTELQTQQRKESPSIAWVAYQQGGVDALTSLLDAL